MRKLVAAALALVVCLAARSAFAWGPLGHRVVAQLAQKQLTPAAQAQVDRLLAVTGARRLADVATWPDDLRDLDPGLYKRTAKFHYVNFHSRDCIYNPPRDCRNGECVVAAIQHYAAILGDRSRGEAERAQALSFVVHFVGDVHQPLHASGHNGNGGNDKGGNDFQVRWHGRGANLHRIWDSTLLNATGLSYQALANRLAANARAVPQGDPVQWAEESCRVVRDDGVYPPTRNIDASYVKRETPVAEERLREAGVRLAALLNRELDAQQRY
ncbi:MAG: S1/P1 nuclease [Rhodanobacteraceae bacterium]